jgi:hypothetical protein
MTNVLITIKFVTVVLITKLTMSRNNYNCKARNDIVKRTVVVDEKMDK